VGVDAQFLSKSQQALLGANLRIGRRPFRATDRPKQNRIGFEAGLQRCGGQGIAKRVNGSPAERQAIDDTLVSEGTADRLETAQAFGYHFGANSVAPENRNLTSHALRPTFSAGCRSRRPAKLSGALWAPL